MISTETVPRIRGGGWGRAVEEGNSRMINLIHCKNLCKCYNLPPPRETIKKIKKALIQLQLLLVILLDFPPTMWIKE
jgi:hypothetical protein